ncbi:glycosyltransferase family 2 protein [Chitinophagaceae bacterium LB-8]|uniref:Glycosyltransferase family 2 protein n=1 Tax=Paraflavisolibacter caeni TaxID=2982496 RepID=A0A9X3BH03_9BACT|nr:glycosyltransferase family 2 protein [Paraflavisolibacter caeni]MCU7548273.1 glycosyltransferase family 2 protein [Paraflavisolibacter caeni]
MKPRVAVIIINYKTSHLLGKLIDSIKEITVDVSIVIVDNASTEETYSELLMIKDARLHILRSYTNLGFTGGINFALKYLIESKLDFKYFFLLNPDAFSNDNLIGDLVQILNINKDAAGVSPQVLYLNGDPWYTGGMIKYNEGKVVNHSIDEIKCNAQSYEVDVFSGCAVLFDLSKVLEVGMFNEDLFMYFDEAELSIRLKRKGYKILYCPQHKIFHDVSYTTRKISHLKTYYMTRNKFIVFNNDMSLYNKIYFILYEMAFHLKNMRIRNVFYHIKGFYDFKRGKKGSMAIRSLT